MPRGLRLAPASAPTADQTPEPPADDSEPPETPTPAPGGTRPALKRIK